MPAGRPPGIIALTGDERGILEAWSQDKGEPRLALRASLILACARGERNSDVATAYKVSPATVGKWRLSFLEHRLAGLRDKPRPGAPPTITAAAREQVFARIQQSDLENSPLSTRCLAEECGLSQSAVSRIRRSSSLPASRRKASGTADTQGTSSGPVNLNLYKSLGSLIKEYRRSHKISQEVLAKSVGISSRQLQRWENNRHRAHMDNLHDLSEVTGIPMPVCLALNADQPIWYSLRERRFAYSAIELAHSRIESFLEFREESSLGEVDRYEPITSDKHIDLILSSHADIYGAENVVGRSVIKKANLLLPDLNYIAFDGWGHYIGHVVCLPLSWEIYERIKEGKNWEDTVTLEKIKNLTSFPGGAFFFYSAFVTSASVGYAQLLRSIWPLTQVEHKERYTAVYNIATRDVAAFFHNFGARRLTGGDHENTKINFTPAVYEIELGVMLERLEASGSLRWIREEHGRRRGAE